MNLEEIIKELRAKSNPEVIQKKERKFGIESSNSEMLGIFHSDLNMLAKQIPRRNDLAMELFDTAIYEARLLCSKLFKAKDLEWQQVEKWSAQFDNWEICDAFSMGVYAKSPLAIQIIEKYHCRQALFQKRVAFATLAAYCSANKDSPNSHFEDFFPLIEESASDERDLIMKAVSWALRSIGKRNPDLKNSALELAIKLRAKDERSSKWIAKDVIRELEHEGVRMSYYPREQYGFLRKK